MTGYILYYYIKMKLKHETALVSLFASSMSDNSKTESFCRIGYISFATLKSHSYQFSHDLLFILQANIYAGPYI